MNFIKSIKKSLLNAPGWVTDKKIVVIESDDWGSISMPSLEIYTKLIEKGVPLGESSFAKYDSLESEEDLNELFNVLTKYKDYKGNYPCITACAVVANPDFEKIEKSNFNEYFYEPITETYKKYPNHANSFQIWKKGMDDKLLWPQFHGREHLNPKEWLKAIKSGNEFEKLAFDYRTLLAVTNQISSKRHMGYLAAFDYEELTELKNFENVIREGLDLFENLFGFRSTTFVAPTSIRSDYIDEYLSKYGIKYHQLGQQFLPFAEGNKIIRNRLMGSKNKLNQLYWRRNGTFEPSREWNYDWIGRVMSEMKIAFGANKPFVISSHRVNYIGSIIKGNRENTLILLDKLIKEMLALYPEIEFMSSDQLGQEIETNPKYFMGFNPKTFYFDKKS